VTIFASASFEYINTSRSTLRLRIVMIISTSGSSNTLKRQYSRAVTVDLSVRMTGLQMDNGTTDRTARLTTRSKQIVFCKCKNSLHCSNTVLLRFQFLTVIIIFPITIIVLGLLLYITFLPFYLIVIVLIQT